MADGISEKQKLEEAEAEIRRLKEELYQAESEISSLEDDMDASETGKEEGVKLLFWFYRHIDELEMLGVSLPAEWAERKRDIAEVLEIGSVPFAATARAQAMLAPNIPPV